MAGKYGNPNGSQEVAATTHNKTVKKATSQLDEEGKLIKRGIGTETPQQKQFRKQVATSGADSSTQRDVLKAAGMKQLPGTGISSTPPAETRKGLGMRPDEMTKPTAKKDGVGIRDKQKTDSVDRALQQRKHPGMQRMTDAMRAAGVSEQRINQYLSVTYSAGPGAERRAERREKFRRRRAAEKYGTPP